MIVRVARYKLSIALIGAPVNPFKSLIQLLFLLCAPLAVCFSFALLVGCASVQPEMPVRLPSRSDVTIGIKPAQPPCTQFLTWRDGTAFDGRLIRQQLIADGDAACRAGQLTAAIDLYRRAGATPLDVATARELAVRRAAVALARGASSDALAVLNGFTRRFPAQEPFPDFGFLLGAAFAGSGDIDQAIAWWSKVYVADGGNGSLAKRSKDATYELIRRVDDATLERVQASWRDDDMVRTALAQARVNRLSSQELEARLTADPVAPVDGAKIGDGLGVLLPLSGRFQMLGERARRGVEIALSTLSSPAPLVAVDSGESVSLIQQRLSELTRAGVSAIVGPLLAEQVDDVAVGVPTSTAVLSLSKRAPGQPLPNFISLGITAEAQIDSILDVAQHTVGLTQLAVIGTNEAMLTFGELVRNGMRDRSISLVLERTFIREDIAAATDIGREIGESRAQGVLFLDGPSIAGSIAAGIPESDRANIKLLGLASWDNEAQLQQSRSVLDGARFVSGFARSSEREVIRNFIATYQQRYREMPDVVAAQGFDAASLVLAAKARQQSGESLVSTLQSMPPFEGLTGRIEHKPDGRVARSLAALQFQNGQITEVR